MSDSKKVLLVGGGTGGHAAPIFAVYNKLTELSPNLEIMVVGVGSPEEKSFFGSIPNYKIICSGKVYRHLTVKNISEAVKMVYGFFQSVKLLMDFKPKIIFSKGGYTSWSIISAAKLLKIPYFLHESDIEMGKANRIMAKDAEAVFVTYPESCYPYIKKEKIYWSGPLLRPGYADFSAGNKKLFGFNNDKPVILITGGSQGSLHLSRKFLEAANELAKNFNVIHQAGKHSIELVKNYHSNLTTDSLRQDYYVTEFLGIEAGKDLMLEAINISDLVIARAGSTIVELAIKQKPMILVPWKHAAQNHQFKNAQFFEARGGALVISDDDLSGEKILKSVNDLFSDDKKKLKELSVNVGSIFPRDGVELISRKILNKIEAV